MSEPWLRHVPSGEVLDPAVLGDLLDETDWAVVTMTVTGEDGTQVDSGFRMQVCPLCATAVPMDSEAYPFRQMHIEHHVDIMRLIGLRR